MNRKQLDKSEQVKEEGDYVNAPVSSVDKAAAPPAQRFLSCSQSFPPIALCWLILLVIMGLRIYFTSVLSEKDAKLAAENQQLQTLMQHLNLSGYTSTLLAVIQDLKNLNNDLTSDNKHLRSDLNNVTMQLGNLTLNYTVLESEVKNLTTQIQQLQTQRNNLTEQITNMETNWINLNFSRAQWSVDAYCPRVNIERRCKACQKGWLPKASKCYAYNNPKQSSDRKTWEEARENCRGKGSDLAVAHERWEKDAINDYSSRSSGTNGYWIGLRAEDGVWKWIDGTELTEESWIVKPTEGRCAISVKNIGWKSVRCDDKQQWICQMDALSV